MRLFERVIMNIKISPDNSYSPYILIIKKGVIADVGKIIKSCKCTGKLIILTNDKIKKLWFPPLKKSLESYSIGYHLMTIPDGERYKNINTYKYIISKLAEYKVDRYGTLLTFGGGVIGDMGGFAASTYKRGMSLIHVPTTLVAQIDSSIGGKTGFNLTEGKNLVGSFYNPKRIIIDPEVLSTLDELQYRNGLFEAIKIALVRNPELYSFIQKNIEAILKHNPRVLIKVVYRCALEKAKVIEEDPFEKSSRIILNFGHTFGHALETSEKYRRLFHGEAVGWGMILAFKLSENLKLCEKGQFVVAENLIKGLISKNRLPDIELDNLWQAMTLDKKVVNNKVRFVLLQAIGQSVIKEINKNQFKKALRDLWEQQKY